MPQPDIFSRLSQQQKQEVTASAQRLTFEKNELLFSQGEVHTAVFVIESGIVRTFYASENGRELTLAYWQPGNLVGTPEVLSEGINQWFGEAVVTCEVLVFKCAMLRSLIERFPLLGIGIIEAMEFKGRWFSETLQRFGTMSVSERILESLYSLGEAYGVRTREGLVLRSIFTHGAIANMVGASRQWVTIELHNLEAKGLIRIGKRSLILLQSDRIKNRLNPNE